nr:NADH dehydrogenase subunit 4L [Peloridora minuta]
MFDFFLFNIFWMLMAGLLGFCLLRKHVLLTLLCLESLNLSLLILISLYFSYSFSESYFYLVFLIFIVCEGVLGLCMLVCLMRGEGNDYLREMELLC